MWRGGNDSTLDMVWNDKWGRPTLTFYFILFYYMRLLLKLQLILHANIIDIYKSDYKWDQHTSMLMERCSNFNPLKYSRDVYSSYLGKEADCLHSNLIEKKNTPTIHCGGSNCCLESSSSHHSAFGRVARPTLTYICYMLHFTTLTLTQSLS